MLLVGVAVFFLVYVPYFFAKVITLRRYHFPDKLDGQTPATYHVEYRDMEFTTWSGPATSDGVILKGWYLPAEHPQGTVIYVHGLNRTRVEMLQQAVFLHGLGYNGLLFDERHAGASTGAVTSLGYFERLDVEAAVSEALRLDPQAKPVVVWGVSMGAAAALMAAKETPDIDAVICDSTFLSLRETASHHLKLFLHLPKFPTAMTAVWFLERFAHFNADDLDLRKAVEALDDRPILFVAGGSDNRMPPSIARELFREAKNGDKMFLEVPGARHGEAFRTNPDLYKSSVTEFLSKVQSSANPASGQPAVQP